MKQIETRKKSLPLKFLGINFNKEQIEKYINLKIENNCLIEDITNVTKLNTYNQLSINSSYCCLLDLLDNNDWDELKIINSLLSLFFKKNEIIRGIIISDLEDLFNITDNEDKEYCLQRKFEIVSSIFPKEDIFSWKRNENINFHENF